CDKWNELRRKELKLFTPKSAHFFNWRYEINPLQQYEVFASPNIYLAAYIKKRDKIKELRIAECIFENNSDIILIKKIIKKWSSKFGVQFITWSPRLLNLGFPSYHGPLGPTLTVRELKLEPAEINLLRQDKNWNYSIGDL